MKKLFEELSPDIFREVEGGNKPTTVASVLLKDEQAARRDSGITNFFREKDYGFTYKKFKELLRPFGSLFKEYGPPAKMKSKHFADPVEVGAQGSNPTVRYDEYVETFFIYLYYELFVRLFSDKDVIIQKNKVAIENARKRMGDIPESNSGDVEENLEKLYRCFYAMFTSSTDKVSKMGSDPNLQAAYFENFVNNNVKMFKEYPISEYMQGKSYPSVKSFVDGVFDSFSSVDFEETGNRQISSIRLLRNFIKGSAVDFDIVRFQSETASQPSLLNGQNPIKFPEKTEAIISEVIEELSSLDDMGSIGMTWTVGTKWEPYVKLLCGIVCLEEISSGAKAAARLMRGEKAVYKQRLDETEQDGGVYFINNEAFVAAARNVKKYKDMVDGLNSAMADMAVKTQYFQSKSGDELIDAMFVKYNNKMAASYIDGLGKNRKAIDAIMEITDLTGQLGGKNIDEVIWKVNFMMFDPNGPQPPRSLERRNEEAVRNAMANVEDYELNKITVGLLDAFDPENVYNSVKEIAETTQEAFSKIFSSKKPFSIDTVVNSFNDTFLKKFRFAKMSATRDGGYKIVKNGEVLFEFNDLDDLKEYIQSMCTSMGSLMYHAKVAFSDDKDESYKQYFNVLSWFVKSLNEAGKAGALGGKEYPFAYLLTPFFLEVVKYSFRAYVNDIEDVMYEDGLIDSDLRDRVKEAKKKSKMEEQEWKPLVEEFSKAIGTYLKKKAGENDKELS